MARQQCRVVSGEAADPVLAEPFSTDYRERLYLVIVPCLYGIVVPGRIPISDLNGGVDHRRSPSSTRFGLGTVPVRTCLAKAQL